MPQSREWNSSRLSFGTAGMIKSPRLARATSGPVVVRGKGPDELPAQAAKRRASLGDRDPVLELIWTDLARVIAEARARSSGCEDS